MDDVLDEASALAEQADRIAKGEASEADGPHRLLVEAARELRDATKAYVTKDYPHRLAFHRWLADQGRLNETQVRRR